MAGEGGSRENERRHRPILCLPEHMALAHHSSPGTQGETRYRGREDKLQPAGVIQELDGPSGKPCLLYVSSSWTWLHGAL